MNGVRSVHRRRRLVVALIGVIVGLGACGTGSQPTASTTLPSAAVARGTPVAAHLRFVALGDSYTIGTSVDSASRWPDQLVARLGGRLELSANLGVNGFTSRDLINRELAPLDALAPQFVTVLIGVNDVVRGVPDATYRANVTLILADLLARLPANRIVAIATPDYTVTPQGAAYGDPIRQSAGIRRTNEILRELATAQGIAFVDIYDISLQAETDRTLVAGDGLHPSGAQYARWVERIAPVVERLLEGGAPPL